MEESWRANEDGNEDSGSFAQVGLLFLCLCLAGRVCMCIDS